MSYVIFLNLINSFFSGLIFPTAQVVHITARITFIHLSTQLIILNYPGLLSHKGSTTVLLETYPLYSFIIITIQLELKKNNSNNNKNHHDSQRLTKCDSPYDFRDKGDNTHTTHQHIMQNAHCSHDIY